MATANRRAALSLTWLTVPDDDEMSQALLQNTTLEYTLADPATGAVRQTCFTLPYDIPQPGSLTIYTYLGKCGSDFYFRADQCDDEYAFVSQSVLRIGTDGTRTDLGITKTPDYLDYSAVLQGDEVRWLLTRGTDGIYLIYDTQGHEIGRNERPAGLEAFFPLCMLDDGRLLMVVGYDWEHDSAARYAVMDADEFLNGEKLLGDNDEDDVESLLIQQIEFCTTIVLNKVEGLTEDQLGLLRTVIHKLQPEANIIETNYGKVDVKDILDTGRFDFDRACSSIGWVQALEADAPEEDEDEHDDDHDHHHDHDHKHHHDDDDHDEHEHHHDHDHDEDEHEHHHGHHHHHHHGDHEHGEEYGISTFVYFRRPPFDQKKFEDFVNDAWPASVIRCKGLIWFRDEPDTAYLYEQAGRQMTASPYGEWVAAAPAKRQAAERRVDKQLDAEWDDTYGDRMQKLVFIGQHMDKAAICAALDACLEK